MRDYQLTFCSYLGMWFVETIDQDGEVVGASLGFFTKELAESEMRWLQRVNRK